MNTVIIHVKFFGLLSEIVGATTLEVKDIVDTNSLIKKLRIDFPKLSDRKFLVSVNKQIISDNKVVNIGDEVAMLPPFSGG